MNILKYFFFYISLKKYLRENFISFLEVIYPAVFWGGCFFFGFFLTRAFAMKARVLVNLWSIDVWIFWKIDALDSQNTCNKILFIQMWKLLFKWVVLILYWRIWKKKKERTLWKGLRFLQVCIISWNYLIFFQKKKKSTKQN